jgi:hypothetical protein
MRDQLIVHAGDAGFNINVTPPGPKAWFYLNRMDGNGSEFGVRRFRQIDDFGVGRAVDCGSIAALKPAAFLGTMV